MTATATRRCQVMLCKERPKGLVRVQALLKPDDTVPSIREIPVCEPCADAVGEAFKRRRPIHLTPEGALYVGNLDNLLPRNQR